MARPLPPAEFFDLGSFAHAALFAEIETCWDALGAALGRYLDDALVPEIRGEVDPAAHLIGDRIQIGEGTVVEPGAYIRGPAIIGKNCEIRHGAYLRGQVLVGDGCVVGHTTEVKGSIFLDGAKAGHFAYVGDSILGNGVNLGAGTKLANFKLTGDEVVVRVDGERVKTGMRKLGAILGDGCQTGCNSVTSPGTLLGKKSLVYPCVSVRAGFYPGAALLR
jgi:UDP-N-acetylglucosamine diphosphorylase / glucose-1-phosphate thymidylyltransferase / UDP-N-acetylgalactosamine diphosphorylase / glucosamine-1-phosphate N-acetyltransferase / galactosamine-1-phosphate N-acetyltransferase